MKDDKKPNRTPLGFVIGICFVSMLCIGSFWGIMMKSYDVATPTPALATQTNTTSVTLPTFTLEAVVIPSVTPPPDPTSIPAAISFPATTEAQVSFSVPVTGASCIPNNPPQTGKVIQVVDGDTIKVQLDQDGQLYSVRYIGMDTPEDTSQTEQFGPEATEKNAELVSGKSVTLIRDVSETDRYGRLLRYVFVEDTFVNYELVSLGYANTISYPPDVSCISVFQEAERQASASKLGLWSAPLTQAIIPTSAASGENVPCTCSGPDLDCKDFKTHASAQACYGYCSDTGYGDVFGLDGYDNDGLACESLP